MWCSLCRIAPAALCLHLLGCGGSQEPTEREAWYMSSLRPGTVEPASHGERELLARMESVPANEAVRLGGQVFIVDAPYASGSGRLCRSVRVEGGPEVELKLACEDEPHWVFVPDVFAGGGEVADETVRADARSAEVTP
jgi:hypothetical protein